jgi:hypothetical protein
MSFLTGAPLGTDMIAKLFLAGFATSAVLGPQVVRSSA